MIAEVAPLAPAAEGIIGLLLILASLVAFGFLWLWRNTLGDAFRTIAAWIGGVQVSAGPIHFHPFGFLANALNWIDSVVDDALSSAALNTQNAAIWLFHEAEAQVVAIGHAIEGLAHSAGRELDRLSARTIPKAITEAEQREARRLGALAAQVASLEGSVGREIRHGIDAVHDDVTAELDRLARGIDRTVHGLDRTIANDVAKVGARAAAAEHDVTALGRHVARIDKRFAAAAMAGTVAAALARLGWDWIKCPAAKALHKRHGCSPWRVLSDLLSPALDVLVVMNVCDLVKLLSLAATEASPVMSRLVSFTDAALCHGNIPPLPPLRLVTTANPKPAAPLPL